MDKTLRNILWVLVTLVMLSSFTAAWFFVVKERLYDDYATLEKTFETTVDRLNNQLTASNKENAELKERLRSIRREFDILESKNRDLKSQYEKLLSERDELNRDLARARKGKFFLEKKIKQMESERFLADLLRQKTLLEVEVERLRKALAPRESEIERLKRQNMVLDVKISKLMEKNRQLEEKAEDSARLAEILSGDLVTERNANRKRKVEFENIKLENRTLKTKIAELEKISEEYNTLLADKKDLEFKVSHLERALGDKNDEIEKLKVSLARQVKSTPETRAEAYHAPGEVELPPIVLQREGYTTGREVTGPAYEQVMPASSLRGRIITVNREHNFVVIDLGTEDGVKIGTCFGVYRDGTEVGSVEVIQTRDRIAACDITEVKEGYSIKTDDTIVKR